MKDGVHAYHFSGVYPERILQRRECQLHSEEAHRNPPHKFYTGHRGLEGRHQKNNVTNSVGKAGRDSNDEPESIDDHRGRVSNTSNRRSQTAVVVRTVAIHPDSTG